jgi:glycosyltransferase 2 family protein
MSHDPAAGYDAATQNFNQEKEKKRSRKYQRAMAIVVVVLFIIGAIIIVLDLGNIHEIAGSARWDFAVYAFAAAVLVFLAQSGSYVLINRAMGIDLKAMYLLIVGVVSIAIGNLVSIVGAAEHVIRALLIVPRGYRAGDVISASVVHSYLKDIVILLLVPIGVIVLYATQTTEENVFMGLIGLGIGSLLLLALITAALFYRPLRSWLLRIFEKIWKLLGKIIRPLRERDVRPELERFEAAVENGKKALRKKPGVFIAVMALVGADWMFTLITLELAFMAFNTFVPAGILMAGFALGKTSGIISFIPGGLGIATLSMAGFYSLMGISIDIAALSVVLYRVISHYIPYLVSFLFYPYLLKKVGS